MAIVDCNGREIQPGDIVEHALAKHVVEWPHRAGDRFVMKEGVELRSIPFSGTRTVDCAVTSTCVRLKVISREIPVFLGEMLEVVSGDDGSAS